MINKAFSIVCDKVLAALEPQGFKQHKIDGADDNEIVALFTSEAVAYSVIYYRDKMHMVMRSCTMTDEGPDDDWKVLGTWIFDPENDKEKDAQSIGNAFAAAVESPTVIKRVKQTKKKSKSDDGNADPVFFAKRLVKVFPELKDEIKNEEDCYYPFRGVTFTREHVVPKVEVLLRQGNKAEITKFISVLSAQYVNGDNDTRSIITIVILNSIDDKYREIIEPLMSPELKKAYIFAHKFKGKVVKPEKIKKTKMSTGTRL